MSATIHDVYTWLLHTSSKTRQFMCSLSHQASNNVFLPSKLILQEVLVHNCLVGLNVLKGTCVCPYIPMPFLYKLFLPK